MTFPPTLIVVVRVNSQCALRCRFCGFSGEVNFARNSIDFGKLSRLGKKLQEHQNSTGQRVLVSWLGGEPFQWHELQSATELFHGEYGLSLGVTTNGLALANPSRRTLALRHFEQITVSVDGLEEQHDWLRQRPGMFAQLAGIVKSLRDERKADQTLLRVNTVLTRGNIESFPEFCASMLEWGFDELTFNQLGGNDRPDFFAENHLCVDQVDRFVEQFPALQERFGEAGLKIQGSEAYLARIRATSRKEKIPIKCCSPGKRFLFVDENVRLAPCSFTSHILSHAVEEHRSIEQLPEWFQSMKRELQPSPCTDCHANHVYEKFGLGLKAGLET